MRIIRTSARRCLLAAVILALAVTGAFAAPAAPENPELTVRVGEGSARDTSRALAIGKLEIDVEIAADTAHTVVTAQFLNSGDRALEGQLTFDLPARSIISGYALDIGAQMVPGVLVGQRQARLVFEDRVRRGIDPGLAEVTRTGAFSTRVFPIFPGKGRTIRLSFVTPLDPSRPFTLPLKTEERVGEIAIRVTFEGTATPAIRGPEGLALRWREIAGGHAAEARAAGRRLAGALEVGSAVAHPVQRARHHSGETFFQIHDTVEPATGAAAAGGRLRIYWDTSRSRRDAALAREIALVSRYIEAAQPAQVDVVFFAAGEPVVRSFDAPRAHDIAAALKAADYHGGTSTAVLERRDLPPAGTCLLFSDGNVTAGDRHGGRMPCVTFAVSSTADVSRAFLASLAERSGGAYVDLYVENEDAALATLMDRAPRVIDVRTADGGEVDYVALPAGANRFRIVGRAPASGAIVVTLARAGTPTRNYTLDPAQAREDDALGVLWAARKVDGMMAGDRPDREAIVAFSRRYSVASSYASFVVFENIEDYVAAGAEPPPSLGKDMIAQYRRIKTQAEADKARAERERIDRVAELWDEQKRWWRTRFPGLAELREKAARERARGEAGIESPERQDLGQASTEAPPPPPPPPPPPLPPAGVVAPAQESAESSVVTASRLPQANLAATSPVTSIASEDGDSDRPSISVEVAEWNPNRPYIKALNAAKPEDYWKVYREQEREHGNLPAFYLDVAEFLFRHGERQRAVEVALSALELPSTSSTTATIVADRLMRYGDVARAVWLYELLLWLEPDRPQPYRNLALALATRADASAVQADRVRDYTRAVDLLNEIVTRPWTESFDGIEVISLMEANRIIPKLRALGARRIVLDRRFIAAMDVDLRVVLEWNTNATDMDLWVDEPSGERAIYSNPKTGIGGRLSNDMTAGYGPEEYMLRRAPNGTYTVRVHGFAPDRLNPNGATTVRARIYRNYGRANESEETLEIELTREPQGGSEARDVRRGAEGNAHLVGTIEVGGR